MMSNNGIRRADEECGCVVIRRILALAELAALILVLALVAGCSAGPAGGDIRLECHVPRGAVPVMSQTPAGTGVSVTWIVDGREVLRTVLSRTPIVLTATGPRTIVQRVDPDGTIWLKRGILLSPTPLRPGEGTAAGQAFVRNVTSRPDIHRVVAVITLLRSDSRPGSELRRLSTAGHPAVEFDCEIRHLDLTAGRITVTGTPPLVADDWPQRDVRKILRSVRLLAVDEAAVATVEIAGDQASLAPGESLWRLIGPDSRGRLSVVTDPVQAAARIDVSNEGGGCGE